MKTRFLQSFVRLRWWVVGLGAILMMALEIFENRIPVGGSSHLVEILIYILTLITIVVLMELLSRALQAQNSLLKILDFKHKLSLEFATHDNWESLTTAIVQFPGKLAAVEETCLLIRNPITNWLESAAHWNETAGDSTGACIDEVCQLCSDEYPHGSVIVRPCEAETLTSHPSSSDQYYCVPLHYGNDLLAVLQFKLKPGMKLSSEQLEIFSNMEDELAITLKANQARKVLSEMNIAETSLAERRTVTDYLHDNLSQNLGYLRLKLDQLLTDKNNYSSEERQRDLERMREAANDAYEIVRGRIESNYSETTPILDNLLLEQARKFSKRSGLEVNITNTGQPVPVLPDIQRTIFFVFQEALSNIEKHSRASKVDICVEWCSSNVSVSVSDNGVGFDPHSMKSGKHYGLEIIHERLARINGTLDISSVENKSTTIRYTVPLNPMDQARWN